MIRVVKTAGLARHAGLVAGIALAVAPMLALPALAEPVYLIANVAVNDWETYMADYESVAGPAIIKAGGEILVGTKTVNVVEGRYDYNWTVVVRFPSEEVAVGFYGSPEYQAVIPIRQATTDTETSVLMLAPQFVLPSQ